MKKKFVISILSFTLIIFLRASSLAAERTLRIVSLAPATTEILFALGLDEQIVGVTTFCNYPEGVSSKQKVGTFSAPNLEVILSLKPDLIFCTALEQSPIAEKLRQLGLDTYISDPSNMNELFQSIREIGSLTHREKDADVLIARMDSIVKQIEEKLKKTTLKSRPRVLIEIYNAPLMVAGKGSFVDDLIRLAGGINIAFDTKRGYSNFSPEQVIRRNPEHIFLAYMLQSGQSGLVKDRLGWSNIRAVKNRQVHNDIEPDLLLRPGPRCVEGLIKIFEKLYQ